MNDKLVQELEELLIPYVLQRYNISNHPLGGLAKTLMRGMVQKGEEYATWIARAFIRCITNAESEIYLKDIAIVASAEAYVMMNFSPTQHLYMQSMDNLAPQTILLSFEMHKWMLYLQEKEKLPGTYNRFTGCYKGPYA